MTPPCLLLTLPPLASMPSSSKSKPLGSLQPSPGASTSSPSPGCSGHPRAPRAHPWRPGGHQIPLRPVNPSQHCSSGQTPVSTSASATPPWSVSSGEPLATSTTKIGVMPLRGPRRPAAPPQITVRRQIVDHRRRSPKDAQGIPCSIRA
jgi:hypothetical protein